MLEVGLHVICRPNSSSPTLTFATFGSISNSSESVLCCPNSISSKVIVRCPGFVSSSSTFIHLGRRHSKPSEIPSAKMLVVTGTWSARYYGLYSKYASSIITPIQIVIPTICPKPQDLASTNGLARTCWKSEKTWPRQNNIPATMMK